MITSIDQLDLNKKYTYADYLTWRLDEWVQLIKGKVVRMSPAPLRKHQEINTNLFLKLGGYMYTGSCKIYSAPFDVRLPVNSKSKNDKIFTVVQPDISVICDISKLDDLGCIGAPDLIVEILSKSSKKMDYRDKYELYQENGVREYWIADPEAKTVDIFSLKDGKFEMISNIYQETEVVKSVIFPEIIIAWKDIFKE